MSNNWMFGMSDEARNGIYAREDRKIIQDLLKKIVVRLEKLEATCASMSYEKDIGKSNKNVD